MTGDRGIFIAIFAFGVLLVVGQKLNWKIFSNPPKNLGFYSHSMINKFFGKKFLGIYNYVLGTALVVVSAWAFISTIVAPING